MIVRCTIAVLFVMAASLNVAEGTAVSFDTNCRIEEGDINGDYTSVNKLPSYSPREVVVASYGAYLVGNSQIDPSKRTSWAVVKLGTGTTTKELSDNAVRLSDAMKAAQVSVVANPDDIDTQGGVRGRVALLTFDPGDVDKLVRAAPDPKRPVDYYLVLAYTKDPGMPREERVCVIGTKPIHFKKPDIYTLKVDPAYAPQADLNNGKKADAGHLGLKLNVPSLNRFLPSNPIMDFANLYFNGEALLSTESQDKQTKIQPEMGLETVLPGDWYIPLRIDGKYVGNEAGTNQSFIAGAGVKTRVPWGWLTGHNPKATEQPASQIGVFWNPLIKAPMSPLFDFAPEFEHIISQTTQHSKRDEARLSGSIHWNPVYIFPSLFRPLVSTAGGEEGQPGPGDDAVTPQKYPSLDLLTKLWGFPQEKNHGTKGRNPFEHRIELSLLLPTGFLDGILGATLTKSLTPSAKPTTDAINGASGLFIRYTTGADDANGFKKSDQISFGVQVVK